MLAPFFALGRFLAAFCASCCVCCRSWSVFMRLGAHRTRFWRVWDSILEGLGLDFGSFPRGFWLDFRSFPRGFWLDFAVFQQGLGLDFGGFGASFSIYFGCLGGSGCQVRLGRCFGPLLGRSWSRLGAVLGPKMDQVTAKLPPTPNPIGVLGRLEGSLERPRSVLGASTCVLKQLPASTPKKRKRSRQFWCPRT